MTDGFALLTAEHDDIRQRFARYAESKDDAEVREICEALSIHADLEERELYPQLRRLVDGGDDLADAADAQHAAVKVLIERIELVAPPENIEEIMREIERLVNEHVEYEEQALFEAMRESAVDADQLGAQLEIARRERAA